MTMISALERLGVALRDTYFCVPGKRPYRLLRKSNRPDKHAVSKLHDAGSYLHIQQIHYSWVMEG